MEGSAFVAAFQNWFTACIVPLVSADIPWATNMIGFRPGFQPLEMIQPIRLLLQKAHAWGLPAVIGSADVLKAFDHMRRDLLEHALTCRRVPLEARLGLLRELAGSRARAIFNGSMASADVPYDKGGRKIG